MSKRDYRHYVSRKTRRILNKTLDFFQGKRSGRAMVKHGYGAGINPHEMKERTNDEDNNRDR